MKANIIFPMYIKLISGFDTLFATCNLSERYQKKYIYKLIQAKILTIGKENFQS